MSDIFIGTIFTVIIPLIIIFSFYFLSQKLKIIGSIMGLIMFMVAFDFYNNIGYVYSWYMTIAIIILAGGYAYMFAQILGGNN
ncbi:MAG: hypothetical protein ABEK36_05280 [Candidatus Aenigmatarchaeota archaeon]